MEVLLSCPICKETIFTDFLKCKDYTVSHETFQLVECSSCQFVFTNPRPDAHEIVRYYQSEDYISHSNSSKGFFNFAYQQVRKYAMSGKVKMISDLNLPQKSILDYGCGTGEFLNAIKQQGWNCKGVEPSRGAREMAIKNYSLKIKEPSLLGSFNNAEFHVITLWHVLEHVHQLDETINSLKRILSPGGYLIVAVPNRQALDAEYYREHWAAYDAPRHLYHFTKANITRLFEQIGLSLKSVRPMFFDPFYISLLSEQYKNGSKNYSNAIFNGIKTNLTGKRNIEKNSSLIYFFQKPI